MRTLGTSIICLLCAALTMPLLAQDYGVGANITVQEINPAQINLEAQWPADAGFGASESYGINITDFMWEGPTEREGLDTWSEMRLGYAEDTLYVFINISRWDGHDYVFPEENPWQGDHLMIGLDPTMQGDNAVDDSWGGWPQNAPDGGPYVYKISPTHGVTLNWGFDDNPDPMEEGWVRGTVQHFDDEWDGTVYRYFGVRLAIYVPGIEPGSQVGFNVGGAFSPDGIASDNNNWFAWRPTQEDFDEERYPREPVAGHLQRYGDSYGTLTFAEPFVKEYYGTGVEVTVPYVAPGTITLDGNADEAEWASATVLSFENGDFYWDSGWAHGIGADGPDFDLEVRLLYTDGGILVNVLYEHYEELFFDNDNGMAILVGIDPLHQAGVSDMMSTGWDGFAFNDPNDAPVVFYMNGDIGITLNWGNSEIDPVAAGFADGVVWADHDNFRWGAEFMIVSDAVEMGNRVGFNVGGIVGMESSVWSEEGDADYAWFSWQTCDPEVVPSGIWCGPGGTMLQNTFGYGSLLLHWAVSSEEGSELPTAYRLEQNYPNPFNPATSITYGVPASGDVSVVIYNALGQRVAELSEGHRTAGTYTLRWSADDMPSGVYLYHLQVNGETVAARKMMLIK